MLDGTGMSKMLKFRSAPDYEMPADADTNNTYMVTVKAEAGGEIQMVEVTVMVTDVDELGALSGPGSPKPGRHGCHGNLHALGRRWHLHGQLDAGRS